MKCPFCGADLNVEKIIKGDNEHIVNGYVKCQCNKYPILDGILYLKDDVLKDLAIEFLNKGEARQAIAIFLLSPSQFLLYKIAINLDNKSIGNIASKLLKSFTRNLASYNIAKYENSSITYYDLQRDTFLRHRFSVQTIWSIYPFFQLLKMKGSRILNLGSGNGHLSFMISKCVGPNEQICLDINFISLYLSKKYFVPNAIYICMDLNYPLPFRDRFFSSIICSDAFPFVSCKASFAQEIDRVLVLDGLILVSHLRNSLAFNTSKYQHIKALPPDVWGRFFDKELNIKYISEKKLIDDFFENKLDLLFENPDQPINLSDPIAILGSRDISIFKIYKNINKEFIENKDNLIINPIYKIKSKNKKMHLHRRKIGDYFAELYPLTENRLPSDYTISGNANESIDDLMRKLIVINVPPKYMKTSDKANQSINRLIDR